VIFLLKDCFCSVLKSFTETRTIEGIGLNCFLVKMLTKYGNFHPTGYYFIFYFNVKDFFKGHGWVKLAVGL
jgi:hypothetical protein